MTTHDEQAHDLLQEALAVLQAFELQPNKKQLQQAASKLLDCMDLAPNEVQPYVCMAYVCHLLEGENEAKHYLEMAEALDPIFPPLLQLKKTLNVQGNPNL